MISIKKQMVTTAILSTFFSSSAGAGFNDDPILSHVIVDDVSMQYDESEHWNLELHGWVGKDLDKFHYDISANNEANSSYIAYGMAFDAYWDMLFGVGYEESKINQLSLALVSPPMIDESSHNQTWTQVGFMGIAPYYIESELWLKANTDGQVALDIQFEHEIMLTQQWAVVPEFSLLAFSKTDDAAQQGSGLAETEFEISLRYEFSREFAIFAKYSYEQTYGNTKRFQEKNLVPTSEESFRLGFRFWL